MYWVAIVIKVFTITMSKSNRLTKKIMLTVLTNDQMYPMAMTVNSSTVAVRTNIYENQGVRLFFFLLVKVFGFFDSISNITDVLSMVSERHRWQFLTVDQLFRLVHYSVQVIQKLGVKALITQSMCVWWWGGGEGGPRRVKLHQTVLLLVLTNVRIQMIKSISPHHICRDIIIIKIMCISLCAHEHPESESSHDTY